MEKNDDLFEYPCVDPAVVEVNFFKSEYYKRHFEEYGDKDDINFVLNKFNEFSEFYKNYFNKVLSKSRQILINYEGVINKRLIHDYYNIVDEYDDNFFKSWIDRAYKITLKYKLSVFDLVCPKNFVNVIEQILSNSFKPKLEVIFEPEEAHVGYVIGYDENKKKILMIIDVSNDIQDSELLMSNAARALVLLKRRIGLKTSEADRNLLIQASKSDNDENYRINGRYGRAVGILIWDFRRLQGVDVEYAIKFLRNKKLIYRNKEICTEICDVCVEKKECERFFKDCYRFACMSILKLKIVATSEKGKSKKKFLSQIKFKRYDD